MLEALPNNHGGVICLSSILLFLYRTPSLFPIWTHHLFYFPLQIICILQFHWQASPPPFIVLFSYFFMLYTHIWGFEARKHRWEMFVFLNRGYLPQYNLFYVHPLTWNFYGFIFVYRWELFHRAKKRVEFCSNPDLQAIIYYC